MNILWILEDALRPDHMGCYGYPRNTTPNCDRLASEGVRFETVISTSAHTLPPIVSMLMGQTAATHGVVDPPSFAAWKERRLWDDYTRTPLHVLADAGYEIDGELVCRWEGLGFTRDTPSDAIEEYFAQHRDRPWFFFAEPYPTHLPYRPPDSYYRMFLDPGYIPAPGAAERLEIVKSVLIVHPSDVISKLEAGEDDPLPDDEAGTAHKRTVGTVDLLPEDEPAVRALYDGEARVFDDLVGCWIGKLESLGILDQTLVIITADHGEELMDRGHVGHSSCNLKGTLYDEIVRVPLILRYPRELPRGLVVSRQVSVIDIMPTVFDMLGLRIPEWMDGASTLPLIRGEKSEFREDAYAETPTAGWQALAADDREIWCVRTADWKLILNTAAARREKRYELYDLRGDPGETRNVAEQRSDVFSALLPKLENYVRRADASGA